MEVQASVLESFQLLENVRMPIAKELYPKKSKQYILFKAEFVISASTTKVLRDIKLPCHD